MKPKNKHAVLLGKRGYKAGLGKLSAKRLKEIATKASHNTKRYKAKMALSTGEVKDQLTS